MLLSFIKITPRKKWKLRRKMLKPAFYLDILPHYFTNIIEVSQNMVECLKKEADGNPIVKDLKSFIGQHTLNIICKSAFGVELTGKNELEIKYPHAIHEFVRISSIRLSRPWYYFDSIFAFSPLSRVQKENLKTLHSFSRNIIAERKRFHKQTNGKYLQINKNNEEDNNLYSKKRLSLLDLLIAASWEDNQIDEEGIREEVDTFMFGGFDTTASALTFALSLFAKHKSVQVMFPNETITLHDYKNIRDEVRSIMQDDNFTMSSLSNLSYLNRCLKESMRLYPSVHVIFRKIFRDLQLKHYLIPSGTIVGVNIYSVHRNPKYWPNPNVFDPDRFLPENSTGRHPYSFIPFSAGRRICIGQNFAMHELRLIVAFILYHFELEPVDELDDVTFAADITLTPIKPLRIKFIPIS
ncbi:PREDICTED: cytochrome P450 4C1-like [Polistes dominula]|uniref:Cytochrome P450 4C1-like n=1 Tax=Polistes dominula TaxID=743375 RepID=A0ABM1IGH2_POLDO|nr:PREDICTED: cytochrome P450 4C1-like [Polistes dominula]